MVSWGGCEQLGSRHPGTPGSPGEVGWDGGAQGPGASRQSCRGSVGLLSRWIIFLGIWVSEESIAS